MTSPSAGRNQREKIRMDAAEIAAFIKSSRTLSFASHGKEGSIHQVAMWYGLVDGMICFETKLKSQKVVNVRRDARVSCLIETGDTYPTLRGLCVTGRGSVREDEEFLWRVGVSVWERYRGPYSAAVDPDIRHMLNNRVAICIEPRSYRSWDHRKLGLPMTKPAGTTALPPA